MNDIEKQLREKLEYGICRKKDKCDRCEAIIKEILSLMDKELIGEDEEEPVNVEHPYYEKYCEEVRMRNVLRQEQRNKLHV